MKTTTSKPRARTSFDDFFDEQMADPEFVKLYNKARARIDRATKTTKMKKIKR